MRNGFICSVFVVFAGASFALPQTPKVSPYGMNTRPASSEAGAQAVDPVQGEDSQSNPSLSRILDDKGTACIEDPCWNGGRYCGPPGRFWASAEYLMWWMKGDSLPPLVTSGPANSTQSPPPGALGANGTVVLSGGDSRANGPFSGGRFTFGGWLNQGQTFGIEGSYFFLGARSNDFTASSSGSTVLARPFLDTSTGIQNSELISYPGLASGTIGVQSSSQLQGAQANALCNLCCSCFDACDPCLPARGYRVDVLGGFRYLDLREELVIVENSRVLPNSPILAGENITAFDRFGTRNQFYGGQIGVRAQVWQKRWFANVTGMVALGDTHQTVDISGFTTYSPPVAGLGGPGGLLALPSNIGNYSRDVFSVVSEVNLNIGYQVTQHMRVFAGYSFLYWSHVARPGDAINLAVNSTRSPGSLFPANGPASPLFTFRDSAFWAQGINVGAQMNW